VPFNLTFDEAHDYSRSDARDGIAVPVTLKAEGGAAHLTASVDTGASFCIFKRGYGELLTVYFAGHEGFGRNVLGRRGWLDHVRLGLVEHNGRLYLSRHGDEGES
jgi:hypothetical protein